MAFGGSLLNAFEITLRYVREHLLVLLGIYIIIRYTHPYVFGKLESSLQYGALIAQKFDIDLPRVYASDSGWFSRWIDRLQLVFKAHEAAARGYRNVPHINTI
jgi:hypothetical protein